MYLKLQVNVLKGLGRFIPTPCHAEPVYGRVKTREAVSCVLNEEFLNLCYPSIRQLHDPVRIKGSYLEIDKFHNDCGYLSPSISVSVNLHHKSMFTLSSHFLYGPHFISCIHFPLN